MTNVYAQPEKAETKNRLFKIGVETLEHHGWNVERVPGSGKSSVRRITKGGTSKIVSIRTTQDTTIAFPRDKKDKSWVTLGGVDAVVAVSVDSQENPKFAQVHMIDGAEMRDRFDRAYKARLAAGHTIPRGRGVWVPLYIADSTDQPSHVGAGAGLKNPPISRVPLNSVDLTPHIKPPEFPEVGHEDNEPLLTIPEAKRRLAITLGVDPSNIKILVDA
jgi:hypothetical protein